MNEYPTADLEREILGQLLIAPELAESSDLLRDTLFSSPDGRRAFAGILALWEELRPASIDPGMLAEKTGLGLEFIVGLVNGNYRPLPANFAWRVKLLHRKRVAARILQMSEAEGRDLVKTGEVDLARLEELGAMFRELKEDASPAGDLMASMLSGAALQALDLRVEWTIDKLQPARSLTLLHSRGGLGKTWLELGAAKAVSSGAPFLGLTTVKRPVYYIDFENPLPLLVERVRKLDIRDVTFWTLCAPTPPPKLDSADWTLYAKVLPPGSMVIFDTLRAAHDGDENSSQDAAIVMGRLKRLRETGLDIVALHHTNKADDRAFKGSTAWADLADHVLDFHQHRRHDLKEADDEDLAVEDAVFSLGTGAKTRFAPFRTFLSFDPEAGLFSVATDPKLEKMDELGAYIAGEGCGANQSALVAWAKEELGIRKRDTVLAMLKRGEGSHWKAVKSFTKNARTYEPIQ